MTERTIGVSALAARFEGWSIPIGYMPDSTARCRGDSCGEIVLWCTTPAKRRIPIDRDGTAHFATCPDAARFRRRRRRA